MTEITKQHSESGHQETHPKEFWDKLSKDQPDIAALYVQTSAKTITTPPEVSTSARKPATESKKD